MISLKGIPVLITGSGGFIGSHLTEELVALGADVTCLVKYNSMNSWGWIDSFDNSIKSKLNIIVGDLKDSDCVRRCVKGKKTIFHLGALIAIPYSYQNPREFIQTNVIGTTNILTAALEYSTKKVIITSTSETYGSAQYVPIDEKHPLQAQSPYAASKISADKIAESFYHSYGLPIAIARPFNTYGPRQSARAIIPTIITQILNGNNIRLGALSPKRDFTYVKDTIDGMIKIAHSNYMGETFNIGSGQEISIGDLVNTISHLIGKEITLSEDTKRLRPKNSEVTRLLACNKKVKKYLNWDPKYPIEQGLRETINWFKENIRLYKTDIYNI